MPRQLNLMRMDRALESSDHTAGEADSMVNSNVFKIAGASNNRPENTARNFNIDLNRFEAFKRRAPEQPEMLLPSKRAADNMSLLNVLEDPKLSEQNLGSAGQFNHQLNLKHDHGIDQEMGGANGFTILSRQSNSPSKNGWFTDIFQSVVSPAPQQPQIQRPMAPIRSYGESNSGNYQQSPSRAVGRIDQGFNEPPKYFGVGSGSLSRPTNRDERAPMLLDDESSIADSMHEVEPKKVLFSNPFFRKSSEVSASPETKRTSVFKGIPSTSGIISARTAPSRRYCLTTDLKLEVAHDVPAEEDQYTPGSKYSASRAVNGLSRQRNQADLASYRWRDAQSQNGPLSHYNNTQGPRVNYFSTLPESTTQLYQPCQRCFAPFEVAELQTHTSRCSGKDDELEQIKVQDIDRALSHLDSKMEDLYQKIHLYMANFLSRQSIGACAIAESGLLKPTIECTTSVKPDELEASINEIEFNRQTILSRSTSTSSADASFCCLLTGFVQLAKQKTAILRSVPAKIRALLVSIKEVDMETNYKLEELKLWKSKCYTMSVLSGGSSRPKIVVLNPNKRQQRTSIERVSSRSWSNSRCWWLLVLHTSMCS